MFVSSTYPSILQYRNGDAFSIGVLQYDGFTWFPGQY